MFDYMHVWDVCMGCVCVCGVCECLIICMYGMCVRVSVCVG